MKTTSDEADSEVDLASQAYQIWKSAIDANPKLRSIIEKLPDVAFSTRAHRGSFAAPAGVLLYMRTSEGNDALAWVNRKGEKGAPHLFANRKQELVGEESRKKESGKIHPSGRRREQKTDG